MGGGRGAGVLGGVWGVGEVEFFLVWWHSLFSHDLPKKTPPLFFLSVVLTTLVVCAIGISYFFK